MKETANVRDVLEICKDHVALCKVKKAMRLVGAARRELDLFSQPEVMNSRQLCKPTLADGPVTYFSVDDYDTIDTIRGYVDTIR